VTADATASAGAAAGCAANVARAWPLLFALGATAAGRATLADAFKLCAPLRDEVAPKQWPQTTRGLLHGARCCIVAVLHAACCCIVLHCCILHVACCMLLHCVALLHVACCCIVLHFGILHVALLHTALHVMQQRLLQRGVLPQLNAAIIMRPHAAQADVMNLALMHLNAFDTMAVRTCSRRCRRRQAPTRPFVCAPPVWPKGLHAPKGLYGPAGGRTPVRLQQPKA
jgi:hypothetical protein